MLRRALLILAGTLVLAGPAAAAGSPLTGTYRTVIRGASPSVLNGQWALRFSADGRYAIAKDGAVVVAGRGTVSSSRASFGNESGPAACKTGAVYAWSLSGARLTMKPVRETCAGRKLVLTSRLTKAG